MQERFSVLSGRVASHPGATFGRLLVGGVLAVVLSSPVHAQDRIQAFVNSNGKIVFTNMVENPHAPPLAADPEPATPAASVMPAGIQSLVDVISRNHGVDPELVAAMMKTESNFNRWAVSPKGALGLMQLIPATGRRFGVRHFFDAEENILGGVRYLKFLLDKFKGNLELSLAAYNAGENVVQKLGRVPPIVETQDYVRKIRAIYKKPSVPAPAPKPPVVVAAESPAPPPIFRSVDARGVIHFSNIEPPN